MKTDLIFHSAHILPMDDRIPGGQVVIIKGHRILAVTRQEHMNRFKGSHTQIIHCEGKTIVPGFIDSHCHLHALAESLLALNLDHREGVLSIRDIQSRISAAARGMAPGEWIRGRGYNEFYLGEKRHPNRWDLDEASNLHPIKLTHRSGHAHVLNSLALHLTGISGETADPPEGLIERDLHTGEPTGLLYEMGDFLSGRIPSLGDKELDQAVKAAGHKFLSLGITTIHDASWRNDREQWERFCRWKEEGLFIPRIRMMMGRGSREGCLGENGSRPCHAPGIVRSGMKIILDETTGRLYPSQRELNEIVSHAHQEGCQIAIHAIEEHAIASACTAIEYALQMMPRPHHRHRIEHCSVCPPHLARRIAASGIMVVTQPSFVFYHGDRYLKTVSDHQQQCLYPLGTLIKSGIRVAGSSDTPIIPPHPFIGIYAAVSRRTETGNRVVEEEGITPLEALQMYTCCGAEAGFEEHLKGSISPGKLADLLVLDRDPTQIPSEELKDVEVEMTVLGGKIVYQKG